MRTKHIKIIIGLFLSIIMCSASQAEITGSAHDFSNRSWSGPGDGSGGRICRVCHIPHNAQDVDGAPLWNHEVTTQTFTPYSSATMDQAPGDPRGVTKLCLSCHDGITAVDSFGGSTGGETITNTANLGLSLQDDHPVSVKWTHQTFDWAAGCTFNCHAGIAGPSFLPMPGTSASAGGEGYFLECISCHDVHNSIPSNSSFLRMDNANSALCLQCHQAKL